MKQKLAGPRSTVHSKWALRSLLFIIMTWTLWFIAKICFEGILSSNSHLNVVSEMTEKILTATNSTLHAIRLSAALLKAVCFSLLHWGYVILPFAHDLIYISTTYIEPFVTSKILIPLSNWLYPVPILTWKYSLVAFRWFVLTVPVEYQISLIFSFILLSTRRLDPLIKTQLMLCATLVFLFPHLRNILQNLVFQSCCFVLVPAVIALHAIAKDDCPSIRRANMLLYFTLLPIVIGTVKFIEIPSSILSLVGVSVAYSSLFSIFYWRDLPYFVHDFCKLVNNLGALSVPALWLRARIIRPMLSDAVAVLVGRYPQSASIFKNLRTIADMSSLNVISITLLSRSTGFREKLFTVFKSVTLLKLAFIGFICISIAVYFLHVAVTNLIMYAIWPWWFRGAFKTIYYKRYEDLKDQLSFTLLFLTFEFINEYHRKTDLIGFLLSVIHIPLVLIFNVAPSASLHAISSTVLFLPHIIFRLLPSRVGKEVESQEIFQVEPEPHPLSPVREVKHVE